MKCSLVPSVFRKDIDNHLKVYGGVNLSVQLREQRQILNPPPSSSFQMSGTTLNAQRSNAIPNSPAQIMDNNMRYNNMNPPGGMNIFKHGYKEYYTTDGKLHCDLYDNNQRVYDGYKSITGNHSTLFYYKPFLSTDVEHVTHHKTIIHVHRYNGEREKIKIWIDPRL